MTKLLITGATGFIGEALTKELLKSESFQVSAAVRCLSETLPSELNQVLVGSLMPANDFSGVLKGVEIVVHLAARAHVIKESVTDPLCEFRKVNVEGTLNLARQAAEAGAKRFVFISSIGVNGNANQTPFLENDKANPQEAYAVSKLEAEQKLWELAKDAALEVVIIRPPLVYACHAPGNFKRLIRVIDIGVPLPLGAVHNQRSLVALDNLVDFIVLCTTHPKAVNETFLISDGEDVSTTALLQKIGKALGKPARLIPVPVGLMRFSAKLLGKSDVAERLFGSLQVDSSKARKLLGWQPVVTMDEQLVKTVEAYRHEKTV